MMACKKKYRELESHTRRLERTFIRRFIGKPVDKPEKYELQVQAYCVLCHAAIEGFLEEIAIEVIEKAINEWTFNHKVTEPLLALAAFREDKIKIEKKDECAIEDIESHFDRMRKHLETLKKGHSFEVNNNHGISLNHIMGLFYPIAIDIKKEPIMIDAFKQLSKERGMYAHKMKMIRKVLSPEDAKSFVESCLELCKDFAEKADARC